MANLPSGWGDRNNQMSEQDMKLGGVVATKFGCTAKNAYENDSGNTVYKNSDQVREFYLKESGIKSGGGNTTSEVKSKSNVPDFWEERQKQKGLEAKQMGVFADKSKSKDHGRDKKIGDGDHGSLSAEVALVQIATHTLEKMAMSLEGKSNVKIPLAERAAFAKAMKEAMEALAKQV
ncbi:hypothetical protein ACHAXR_010205 [Thalassiosira sp. AJA248-18]